MDVRFLEPGHGCEVALFRHAERQACRLAVGGAGGGGAPVIVEQLGTNGMSAVVVGEGGVGLGPGELAQCGLGACTMAIATIRPSVVIGPGSTRCSSS